jgi:flagellin
MSFRINTNVGALSAFNSVNQVTDMLSKSQGKLSSGLRIKDASDDPAGLISSELFRSQINSMDAALRNNQEALNYAKTAENALGEMSKLLSDARGLAIASGNSATLTAAQVAANQDQVNSIIASIDRISTTVTYSGRKLLDGSAGTTTQISNQTKVSGFSFGGSLGTTSITANGLITLQQTTAATRALYTATSLLTTGAVASGTVALNGVNFNISAGTAGASLANVFNAASAQTGVTASWNAAGNQLTFQSVQTGSNKQITFTDTTGVVSSAANTTANVAGVDAAATVTIGGIAALFTGGRSGADGLTLTDSNGNKLLVGEGGNAVSAAAAVGRVVAQDSNFQIGFLSGVTANLALRNMGSSQLGAGVVSGTTLNNLDFSTAQSATSALAVLDKAIEEVSSMRGKIGNFQRNVLETNNRSLTNMRENLSASESSIRDLDVANEMTHYTKLQVMQQAGMSILGQANQSGQAVMSLLRN